MLNKKLYISHFPMLCDNIKLGLSQIVVQVE